MEDSSPHLQPAPAAKLKEFETLKCNEQNHFNYNSLHLKEQLNLSIFITVISEVKISSPSTTQGGQPCKQQNSAQGGPPCAS